VTPHEKNPHPCKTRPLKAMTTLNNPTTLPQPITNEKRERENSQSRKNMVPKNRIYHWQKK